MFYTNLDTDQYRPYGLDTGHTKLVLTNMVPYIGNTDFNCLVHGPVLTKKRRNTQGVVLHAEGFHGRIYVWQLMIKSSQLVQQ